MKKYNFVFLVVFALLFAACDSKKNDTESQNPNLIQMPDIALTEQDTTEVLNLVDQYMSLFKSGDIDGASSLLNIVRNDSIIPYSAEQRQEFATHLAPFHVYDYHVRSLVIRDRKDNSVEIDIQIMPDGDLELRKGVSKFVLNPVKKDNHWYLTLMDLGAEGIRANKR